MNESEKIESLAMMIYSKMTSEFYFTIMTNNTRILSEDEIKKSFFKSAELSMRAAENFIEFLKIRK